MALVGVGLGLGGVTGWGEVSLGKRIRQTLLEIKKKKKKKQ